MKNFRWIIVGILVPIILVLLNYALNEKSPNVRYSLSKGIHVPFFQNEQFSKHEDISVQELVVKNIGNATSKKIQIRIEKSIIKYNITKNLSGDNPQVFSGRRRFELLYPELPPDGEFRLVFYSSGDGVTDKDLIVKDQNGLCKPAFYQSKNIWDIFLLFIFVTYLVIAIIFILISFAKDRWQTLQYKDYYEIISKRKPFYLSVESWNNIIRNALEENLSGYRYYGSSVEESIYYKILSSDKPELLPEYTWKSILEISSDRFENMFVEKIDYLYEDNILKLLRIEKPKHFSQDKWDKIQETLSRRYFLYKKSYIILEHLFLVCAYFY